jgi:DNA modification methylase
LEEESITPLDELLDSVKDIDGFPKAKDEDILALSNPPYYTACPNPYLKDFIDKYGKAYDSDNDEYEKTPFFEDVSEGKYDPIYTAYSYHTKVPHKAIMKFIDHYTKPGDIVFDGFCGSGMTGIAAAKIDRMAILSDLSPYAVYLASQYNMTNDKIIFEKTILKYISELKKELGWLFKTNHDPNSVKDINTKLINVSENIGTINYVIWSDIFICPYCKNEFAFWDLAVDDEGAINSSFSCNKCGSDLKKSDCKRAFEDRYDTIIKENVTIAKEKPVLINYSVGKKRFFKKPDQDDLDLITKINDVEIPYNIPTSILPDGVNTRQPMRSHGYSHTHQFYTKRNLWVMAKLYDFLNKENDKKIKNLILWVLVGINIVTTKMVNYTKGKPRPVQGTLYIGSLRVVLNPINMFYNKAILRTLPILDELGSNNILSTNSITNIPIYENSIDYIFTDPPFGANIMYSELNILWENWIQVFTNNKKEAIINNIQNKELDDYKELMLNGFQEMFRILKPNRWITVVFHNSRASVWNAIQESMARAGFVIAQVSVLDKQQGTFKQVTSSGAVKNDLIINAYKPKEDFSKRFLTNAGEGMEVDFIIQQLEHLPVRPNIERTEKMLYSKMLAHYVENGFKIRYDSTNFYRLLSDNFTELDGFWFLDTQIKEYNDWKGGLSLDEIKELFDGQQVLFISDEKSALIWIYHYVNKPKTYNEIFTEYQQVSTTTEDDIPELKVILDNNFILENGKYRRPLSDKEKEEKSKNRERELNRDFNKLLDHARRNKEKIKSVRRAALIHGFTKCYQEGKYEDILTIADKLHSSVLESSGEIMDFVDIAKIKTSGKKKIEDF